MSGDGTDAVLVQPSLPVKRAASPALEARLPSASPIQNFARDGGLVCYSGRISEQFRLIAQYVDRILKGAKPADLPVQIPTQFDLRLNVQTAKAIGVVIPPAILLRADEVIEQARRQSGSRIAGERAPFRNSVGSKAGKEYFRKTKYPLTIP